MVSGSERPANALLSLGDDQRQFSSASKTTRGVSPGLQPRPSLSDVRMRMPAVMSPVSPGLQPRPSLSAASHGCLRSRRLGVAGVTAPALIERHRAPGVASGHRRVAGVTAPALIERG